MAQPPHLLFVEDDPYTLETALRAFSGYRIDSCTNLVSAYQYILQPVFPYDAIISDYQLGNRQTGLEIWQAVRNGSEKGRTVPFIGTSSRMKEGWQRVMDSGRDKHFFGIPKRHDIYWDTDAMLTQLHQLNLRP